MIFFQHVLRFSLAVILLNTHSICAETEVVNETKTETETIEYGPITTVMENLGAITVNVSDETSLDLQKKLERTVNDLTGNIEVLVANALQELSDAIYQTNQIITNSTTNCNPTWNMQNFMQNIDQQLTDCTEDMRDELDTFRTSADAAVQNVQSLVQQIAQLPVICQIVNAVAVPAGWSFADGTNCFVQRIAEINKDMSQELNHASVLMVRTRQLTEQGITVASKCTSAVIADALSNLDAALVNCQ